MLTGQSNTCDLKNWPKTTPVCRTGNLRDGPNGNIIGSVGNPTAIAAFCWSMDPSNGSVTDGNDGISSDDGTQYSSRVWWKVTDGGRIGYLADVYTLRLGGGRGNSNTAPTPGGGSIGGLPHC